MRKLVSIVVIASFMLISALAHIGDSYASSLGEGLNKTQLSFEQQSDLLAFLSNEDIPQVTQKDECPCEKESSATKFVCGVALALAGPPATFHLPVRAKLRYAFYKPAALKSFVDLLKRPPRTIL